MYFFWILIYNLIALPILVASAYLFAPVSRKLRRGLRGRRKTIQRVKEFRKRIGKKSRLYWFHVASLGEYEQTRLIVQALKEISPERVIAVSFFSPSGYEQVNDDNIDFKFYLPLDFPWTVRRLLRKLKPAKVIFASYDLWPNLVWAIRAAKVPATLFAARIVGNSTKLKPVARSFFRQIYGSVRHIYTVTDDDHDRIKLIVGNNRKTDIRKLGNPRYDRAKARNSVDQAIFPDGGARVIVLGSMHKEDHELIAGPIIELLQADSTLRVLWAPHDPDPDIIASIGEDLNSGGIDWETYSHQMGRFREKQVLIIDGIGYLAELYSRGCLAYVGGGFGNSVHNVMEPAVAGIPVIFGPNFQRSHEAEQLLHEGGAFMTPDREEWRKTLGRMLSDNDARQTAGMRALKVMENNLGASARILQAILGR
ncbi:3-deoxy-D-manno-octulosonic acid transferase [Candidatus Neomarinimicrobiota bacterium]